MTRLVDPQRQFKCCFCLHVRTGTIILGVGLMLLHLVVIAILTLATIKPDVLPATGIAYGHDMGYAVMSVEPPQKSSRIISAVLRLVPGISDLHDTVMVPHGDRPISDESNESSSYGRVFVAMPHEETGDMLARTDGIDGTPGQLDTPDKKPRYLWNYYGRSDGLHNRNRRHFSPYLALCLSIFSLTFCCLLIHGAIARQPTHLLPFFFLHVFDFIISLLSVIGYMSSPSDMRVWLHTKNGEVQISSANLTFFVISISCLALAFKAYCLGMVWDCYKYLMLTNQRGRTGPAGHYITGRAGFLPSLWGVLGVGSRRSGVHGSQTSGDPRLDLNDSLPSDVLPDPAKFVQQTDELPKYEDALKTPANAFAPPPYFRSNDGSKTVTVPVPVTTANPPPPAPEQ